jgi:hypothetical protein
VTFRYRLKNIFLVIVLDMTLSLNCINYLVKNNLIVILDKKRISYGIKQEGRKKRHKYPFKNSVSDPPLILIIPV